MRFTLQCGFLIMSDINWDEAPEGATHITNYPDGFNHYYKLIDDGLFIFNNITNHWENSCNESSFVTSSQFIIKLPSNPEFNKEFCVRGGDDDIWFKCKIVFVGKRYTVVENENGKEFSRKSANIRLRDVTPPIELIDGKAYQFQYKTTRGLGFYNERLNEFSSLNHKICIDDCTNIQLLEASK